MATRCCWSLNFIRSMRYVWNKKTCTLLFWKMLLLISFSPRCELSVADFIAKLLAVPLSVFITFLSLLLCNDLLRCVQTFSKSIKLSLLYYEQGYHFCISSLLIHESSLVLREGSAYDVIERIKRYSAILMQFSSIRCINKFCCFSSWKCIEIFFSMLPPSPVISIHEEQSYSYQAHKNITSFFCGQRPLIGRWTWIRIPWDLLTIRNWNCGRLYNIHRETEHVVELFPIVSRYAVLL